MVKKISVELRKNIPKGYNNNSLGFQPVEREHTHINPEWG